MANRHSPQSPSLQYQVPNQMSIGIEIPFDPDMPEPELTPSQVAGHDGSINFKGFFTEWTWRLSKSGLLQPTLWLGGLVFSVEEAEIATKFRDFLLFIYGNIWEKRNLSYITMVTEHLKALITSFCKLPKYHKTQWAERFDVWPPSTLRVQWKGLAESGRFLETDYAPGSTS